MKKRKEKKNVPPLEEKERKERHFQIGVKRSRSIFDKTEHNNTKGKMIIFLFGFSVWRRLFLSSPISHSITYYLNSEIAVKCPFVLDNIQCNVQEIRVDVIYMDLFHACIIYS